MSDVGGAAGPGATVVDKFTLPRRLLGAGQTPPTRDRPSLPTPAPASPFAFPPLPRAWTREKSPAYFSRLVGIKEIEVLW